MALDAHGMSTPPRARHEDSLQQSPLEPVYHLRRHPQAIVGLSRAVEEGWDDAGDELHLHVCTSPSWPRGLLRQAVGRLRRPWTL